MRILSTILLIAATAGTALAQPDPTQAKGQTPLSPPAGQTRAQDPMAKMRSRAFDPTVSREERYQLMLAIYDENQNGKLDPGEVEKIGRDRIMRWDKDGDGKLSEHEIAEMRANSRQMPSRERASQRKKPSSKSKTE